MALLQIREALRAAIDEEMARDERVFVMGEEVGYYDGAYKVTEGLLVKYGERRVVDTPIAEAGFAGVGIGAAMAGLRPIIEFMTFNFSAVAFDQILNNAAKLRQMSGGQLNVPIVFRAPNGSARQVGSQHSHAMEHFYAHIPGLKCIAPATPEDAYGMMKTAIRDDNPVLVFESETLYSVKGDVPDDTSFTVPLGKARLARPGKDCTVIAWSRMVHVALEAAELLAKEGIDVEVVDLRSIRPLDEEAIVQSVRKTHRAVVAYEGFAFGGIGAEIVDRLQRLAFDDLDAPVGRVGFRDVGMPYNAALEQLVIPDKHRIAQAIKTAAYARLASYTERDTHGQSARHAQALPDDGGGSARDLAQAGGRQRRGRRAARRGGDRQGDHGVSVVRQGHAAEDPRARRQRREARPGRGDHRQGG